MCWHAVGNNPVDGSPPARASGQQDEFATHASRTRGAERFSREHRLRSSADFARVRQVGRSVSGAYLSLGFARRIQPVAADVTPEATQPAGPTRVGFAVGKRVGGAVIRNLVKRRLREAMRRRMRLLTPGWDLVVVARPPAAGIGGAELADELDRLLSRAKVLASGSERSRA